MSNTKLNRIPRAEQTVREQGWQLDFDSFVTVDDFVLPRKMSVRNQELLLKLVADEWVITK